MIKTFATTVRCDARDAAMAHALLDSYGIRSSSVADLFRNGMSLLADLAVSKGLVPKIESTQEALDYLRNHQVIDLLEGNRPNKMTLVKALAEESGLDVSQAPADFDRERFRALLEQQRRDVEQEHIGLRHIPEDIVEEGDD